jgi:hypothetical protein
VKRTSDLANRFPGLAALGRYLDQPWDYLYGSPEAAVLEFCAHRRGDMASLASALAGIEAVLTELPDETARLDALDAVSFCYQPDDGEFDEFLAWTRDKLARAIAGDALPRYRLPRSTALESTTRFLARYERLAQVGAAYFTGDRSPDAGITDHASASPLQEVLSTYKALLTLHFDARDEAEQRRFLSAGGWSCLPPDGELGQFIRRALDVLSGRLERTGYAKAIERDMRPRLDPDAEQS